MRRKGIIIEFPKSEFEVIPKDVTKVLPLPIKIKDIETGEEKTYNHFKWEGENTDLSLNGKQQMVYYVTGEGDLQILHFELK